MADSHFHETKPLAEVPRVGVGMLGYGFMGRAHSLGYRRLIDVSWPPTVLPRLVAICGRNEERVSAAAQRYGYEGYYTDWEEMIADTNIQVLSNGTQPSLHAEPSIAALKAGKHVICEKPLAPTMEEARAMWEAARASGRVHMTGFNYRFVPALRLARELIQSGALGEVYLFRAVYLQEFRREHHLFAMASTPEGRGRGTLNNLGAHVIDMAHFLVGDIAAVSGKVTMHVPQRPAIQDPGKIVQETEDDTFHGVVDFANGATGTITACNVIAGRKNFLEVEVSGTQGSLHFNLERLNELEVYLLKPEEPSVLGFRDVMVTEGGHPSLKHWWPRGHVLGWEALFAEELLHFLTCVKEGRQAGPEGATFEDGYKAALVAEALRRASREGRRIDISDLE